MTGDQMRAYRKERGLSQRQLAKELGISQQSISAIERGSPDLPDERDDTSDSSEQRSERVRTSSACAVESINTDIRAPAMGADGRKRYDDDQRGDLQRLPTGGRTE